MLFNTLAGAFTSLSKMKWCLSRDGHTREEDWTVAVMGNWGVSWRQAGRLQSLFKELSGKPE